MARRNGRSHIDGEERSDHTKAELRCLMLLKHGRMRQTHESPDAILRHATAYETARLRRCIGEQNSAGAEKKKAALKAAVDAFSGIGGVRRIRRYRW
jgi:hypothetical protein